MEYSRQYAQQFPHEEFTQGNHFLAVSKIILIPLLFIAITQRRAIFAWCEYMIHERPRERVKSEKREANIAKRRSKAKALKRRAIIQGQ